MTGTAPDFSSMHRQPKSACRNCGHDNAWFNPSCHHCGLDFWTDRIGGGGYPEWREQQENTQ